MLGSNSSGCPVGFFPLDYEKGCQRAAVIADKPYGGSLSNDLKAAYMSGCYWHTVNGNVYFNDKPASAPDRVDAFALQLCAGAPIPVYSACVRAKPDRGLKGCVLGLRVRCLPCLLRCFVYAC